MEFFFILHDFLLFLLAVLNVSPSPQYAAFRVKKDCLQFSFVSAMKNARLTPFDAQRSKPTKTEKSSRFRLLSAPM